MPLGISGTFNFMIVFQAEHNILMHPFHMLGKIYASPTVHHALFCCTLPGFWVPRNLVVDESRFETRLNGGGSSVFSVFSPNTFNRNLCAPVHVLRTRTCTQKLCCMGSSLGDSNNSTENNPVPIRMAPRQLPGVYMILCLANNKRYYGESKNVSVGLSQHKSRLRRNLHEVPELQRDFNLYGEEHFEFSAVWLDKNCTPEQRLVLEIEFIARFHDLCYNKFAKISRKKENNPFWGRTHNAETCKQISRSIAENRKNSVQEGFAINLKGVVYPSITEASRQTKHSRDTIRRWLNDPRNLDCVAVDVSQPRDLGGALANIGGSNDPL
eukprot:GHRR01000025.1.p1 GENE.GHRR01000025.1~~GHRR01000025.1.p1  ORF type:complete len:326 (+),score=-70.82 GHRR01000025.1:38-1015(+)